MTTGISYASINNTTILNVNLQPDGLINLNRQFFNNKSDRLMFVGEVSKYLFALKSSIKTGVNLSLNHQYQIQNDILLHITNKALNANAEINSKVSEHYNFDYKIDYLIANNHDRGNNSGSGITTNDLSQKFTFTYFLKPELYFQTFNEFQVLSSSQLHSNMFFNDLKVSYKFIKSKTDIGLSCLNTFNRKEYFSQSQDLNSFETNSFRFRPRTIFASIRLIL